MWKLHIRKIAVIMEMAGEMGDMPDITDMVMFIKIVDRINKAVSL